MKLHNTLTKQVAGFTPLSADQATIYSCGPTVYDHIHIGNLRAFVSADILRRTLKAKGLEVKHVMNITDVDDKTIARSSEQYFGQSAEDALKQLTHKYEQIFMADMTSIGNDIDSITFVRATDSIQQMQELIKQLYQAKIAYIADDGVYFSIEAYQKAGKTYGQLLQLNTSNTSESRIDNDEYDKAAVRDFALWKTRKANEPAWEFELDGHDLLGRPGWHIECSAMSTANLGQPFDIHTGGVDLIFPHHENEIAQSTATTDQPFASVFVHNEHLLVDGRKMSKSLDNFFTLRDIQEKGFEPLAYRLLVLQAHYRKQLNFTWEALEAAQNRLRELQHWADLQFQPYESPALADALKPLLEAFEVALQNDLDTPVALATISQLVTLPDQHGIDAKAVAKAVGVVENYLMLGLTARHDISAEQKQLLSQREQARDQKDWSQADAIRQQLENQGIGVKDTPQGQIWMRL